MHARLLLYIGQPSSPHCPYPNTDRLGDDHCNVFLFSLSVWELTTYLNTPYFPYPRCLVRCSICLGALDLFSFQEVAGLAELRNHAHASLLVNT